MTSKIEWIAVDWGTSNLRIWGVDAGGNSIFSRSSDKGMGRISSGDYPLILKELLETSDLIPEITPVIICGMAGARQGWCEAPYLDAPMRLNDIAAKAVKPADAPTGLDVFILPGIAQRGANPDVMRGEETQLLGLSQLRPDYAGPVCMPGTHAKWATVKGPQLLEFSTAMTGEIFDLLANQSVLRHSLSDERSGPEFDEGLDYGLGFGLNEPAKLLTRLFKTRAETLVNDRSAAWCAGYLSGILIGSEVANFADRDFSGTLPLIGSEKLSLLYAKALALVGIKSEIISATTATLAGLAAARDLMQ